MSQLDKDGRWRGKYPASEAEFNRRAAERGELYVVALRKLPPWELVGLAAVVGEELAVRRRQLDGLTLKEMLRGRDTSVPEASDVD